MSRKTGKPVPQPAADRRVLSIVGVIAVAKKDLAAGDLIDEFGGHQTYGVADNIAVIRRERLLPIGLGIGCRLKRMISKDSAVTFDDVVFPPNRTSDLLYAEQERHFAPTTHQIGKT